jgi:hypothetical protein
VRLKDRRRNRRGVADQVRTLIRRAHELAGDADPAAFNRPPSDGAWSAGQCFEHLNETARIYLPVIAEAMEAGRAAGHTHRSGDGRTILGRLIAWSQEPPVRFRFRTFQAIEPPREELDPGRVLEDFEVLHEELIVRINEAGTLDCRRIRFRSPLDRRLKLCLGDWFAFLAAHGRRHLLQADRALDRAETGRDP